MKLPRWLVICLLTSSVLAVLAAAGWWWVTWPERTAREFVELIAAGRVDDARKMVRFNPNREVLVYWEFAVVNSWRQAMLQNSSRTLFDVLVGRQEFHLVEFDFHFTVQRGTVVEQYHPVLKWMRTGGIVEFAPSEVLGMKQLEGPPADLD